MPFSRGISYTSEMKVRKANRTIVTCARYLSRSFPGLPAEGSGVSLLRLTHGTNRTEGANECRKSRHGAVNHAFIPRLAREEAREIFHEGSFAVVHPASAHMSLITRARASILRRCARNGIPLNEFSMSCEKPAVARKSNVRRTYDSVCALLVNAYLTLRNTQMSMLMIR